MAEVTSILSREEALPQVSVFFFKSVVQLVLIFAAETWVVSPCVGQVLGGGGFQDQVAKILIGRLLRRQTDGKWGYTSAVEAIEEAG